MGANWLDFAAAEAAVVVSDRKGFKSLAKGVGKQTLRKHLGSGSQLRTVVSKKASKQANCSPRYTLTNVSRYSCQPIVSINLLWQILETKRISR